MKQVWIDQARRIDALSLRERVFMFVSVALALSAVADLAVISPALAERRQLTLQMRQQTQQIESLRTQFALKGAGDSPEGRQRAAIDGARSEQQALDSRIREQFASRDEIARLPVVLDRLLRQHDRLVLVRLSLAPTTATAAAAAAATPAAAAVRWQGVDLSVTGSYPDLVQYLTELEKAMPGLRWGPLQIATPTLPPVLTVRLLLVAEAS
jgi:MSHA biogenesis protein MshJ